VINTRRLTYDEMATREYSAVVWMLGQLPPVRGHCAHRLLYALVAMRAHLESDLTVNHHEIESDMSQ